MKQEQLYSEYQYNDIIPAEMTEWKKRSRRERESGTVGVGGLRSGERAAAFTLSINRGQQGCNKGSRGHTQPYLHVWPWRVSSATTGLRTKRRHCAEAANLWRMQEMNVCLVYKMSKSKQLHRSFSKSVAAFISWLLSILTRTWSIWTPLHNQCHTLMPPADASTPRWAFKTGSYVLGI